VHIDLLVPPVLFTASSPPSPEWHPDPRRTPPHATSPATSPANSFFCVLSFEQKLASWVCKSNAHLTDFLTPFSRTHTHTKEQQSITMTISSDLEAAWASLAA
jgi:hypothetical protein